MRPYGHDPLLDRAMRRFRAENPDQHRAKDPIVAIPAPKKGQRQFGCRLCGIKWPPWRGAMPRSHRESRSAHRCWVSPELINLHATVQSELEEGPSQLAEVLRDRIEELSGART